MTLIKIRTLADPGVPLARITQMLDADPASFAAEIRRIDRGLRDQVERLRASRRQVAQLAAGDSLALPPEVAAYLERLRELGVSKRMVEAERDGWILVAARWPDQIRSWMPAKFAELENPQLVRLYRILSQVLESADSDEPLLAEAADILVALSEAADAAGQGDAGVQQDTVASDLLDGLAVESDPRAARLLELVRERGWASWTRMERVPGTRP